MCPNPQANAYAVMVALRPEIVNVLTIEGVAGTTQAQTALAEYDVAAAAVQAWKPGSTSDNILQIIGVFQAAIAALGPLVPTNDALIIDAILASIAVVIGIIKGNSAAPPAPAGSTVSAEENQFHHQAQVRAETEAEVEALVPGFKVSRFHTAAHQARKVFNDAVVKAGRPDLRV